MQAEAETREIKLGNLNVDTVTQRSNAKYNNRRKQSLSELESEKSYLTGGPELHDGLSPTVLEYSRMQILSNLSESCLLERPVIISSSDPYVLCKLSSMVRFFIIDLGFKRLGNE